MVSPFRRQTDFEPTQVGDYFNGTDRYYDQINEVTVVKIHSGEWYVNDAPSQMIVTILGSCVAACIRDPEIGIGGMNHFLLPECTSARSCPDAGFSARYGMFAMEKLINDILKHGGQKQRLEAKLFGGGNVIESSAMIGDKNAAFAVQYLKDERIRLVASDLGDVLPRRVHYFPDTGVVRMRKLKRREDYRIVKEERDYELSIADTPSRGDAVFFS